MNLKTLFEDQYKVLATTSGDSCPALEFLINGEDDTEAYRLSIIELLRTTAREGLHNLPAVVFKVANRENGIYEFKKGSIRLFFFRGNGQEIVVCTGGVRKKTQKADKQAIAKAIRAKSAYLTGNNVSAKDKK
ncbi:MAG: type II toxin-antitoxin system RelE/ParE family toxin [Dechloromonas sp.]|uniref:type II toxin-antitoxin system RelE/ParE family toxin n=1 Tax=Dechloromonas sp. TaxID=1917218 RepID=UPI0027EE2FB2|nr:type II toxin-antitoxin system RelE/ParE family toxin [Dechloromonas sp.]MBT9521909.1 type II toxin-antitoxin system RelE/ParE family toxin [Dechloromonas sp.]